MKLSTAPSTSRVASLMLVLSALPFLSSCAGYVERVRAAERAEQEQRERTAKAIIENFKQICQREGFVKGMENANCVLRKAEIFALERAARGSTAPKSSYSATPPAPTPAYTQKCSMESSRFLPQNMMACTWNCNGSRFETVEPVGFACHTQPINPQSSKKPSCSLISTWRLLPNDMVACPWNCGGNTVETLEHISSGCQKSPIQ
jgi:hypothetical protein